MLKKVRITNFLSCQDTEIELDTITALIGRNAAGKTNILKAIEWCAQFAVGGFQLDKYLPLSREGLEDYYNIEFLIDDRIFKYERNTTAYYSRDEAPVIVISLSETLSYHINNYGWKKIAEREGSNAKHYDEEISIEINSEAPLISSLISLLPQKIINPNIKKIFNYFNGIKYYELDGVEYRNDDNNVFHISGNDYKQWLSSNSKEKSSVIMRLLHLWHDDKETLEELQALIGKNGLNLINSIEIIQIDLTPLVVGKKQQQDYSLFYTVIFNMANAAVNYNQLSYGTQRALTLLLALLYDKSSILLIEQPEDGIHSGLLKKLLPLCFVYAKTYNKQLIIATHSPDIINLLPPESIRLVKMTEKGTKVASLDKDQMPFILDYMKNEGALFDFIQSMNDE